MSTAKQRKQTRSLRFPSRAFRKLKAVEEFNFNNRITPIYPPVILPPAPKEPPVGTTRALSDKDVLAYLPKGRIEFCYKCSSANLSDPKLVESLAVPVRECLDCGVLNLEQEDEQTRQLAEGEESFWTPKG